MTDETTSEQLAEIEGQGESTPATEYTPPEGWRVLAVGEVLREGDVRVDDSGACSVVLVTVTGVVPHGRRYIRPIEPQPVPVPQPEAAAIEELRSEVSYVQNLLGTERRRVTHLEELVTSLRTINEAQEKSFNAANKANDDLQHRLNVVAAEWAEQAETIRRLQIALNDKTTQCEILQIELDAAQPVPADSPELRQLRADLAEVTQERDTYRHAHELLLNDANTSHETTKAMTVEAIAEWLEPIRLVDSPNLANETLQHLPQIMRSLVGLDSPEDVD